MLYVCETQMGGQRGGQAAYGGSCPLNPSWRRHWGDNAFLYHSLLEQSCPFLCMLSFLYRCNSNQISSTVNLNSPTLFLTKIKAHVYFIGYDVTFMAIPEVFRLAMQRFSRQNSTHLRHFCIVFFCLRQSCLHLLPHKLQNLCLKLAPINWCRWQAAITLYITSHADACCDAGGRSRDRRCIERGIGNSYYVQLTQRHIVTVCRPKLRSFSAQCALKCWTTSYRLVCKQCISVRAAQAIAE